MGVSETMMGTAMAGIIGSLVLGQPLLILGITGPNVVFEEALYKFCNQQEMNYLSVRVWTGFWILLITLGSKGSIQSFQFLQVPFAETSSMYCILVLYNTFYQRPFYWPLIKSFL